jgi:hypothetical protein
MKRYLLLPVLLLAIYCLPACRNGAKFEVKATHPALSDTASYTAIRWADSVQQFGLINKGEKVRLTFHFRNTGTKPLFIADVRPGCGCTLADYTREPVAPGGEGSVTAEYNSEHATAGIISKDIVVTSNTPASPQTLSFNGEVKEKE